MDTCCFATWSIYTNLEQVSVLRDKGRQRQNYQNAGGSLGGEISWMPYTDYTYKSICVVVSLYLVHYGWTQCHRHVWVSTSLATPLPGTDLQPLTQ